MRTMGLFLQQGVTGRYNEDDEIVPTAGCDWKASLSLAASPRPLRPQVSSITLTDTTSLGTELTDMLFELPLLLPLPLPPERHQDDPSEEEGNHLSQGE